MVARLGDYLDEEIPQGVAGLSLGLPGPQGWLLFPWPLPSQALLERGQGAVFLFRPLPCNAKSLGPADSAPKPVQPVVWEKGGTWEGQQEVPEAASPSPARTTEPLGLWMLQTDPRTDRQLDAWPGHEAHGGTVFSSDGTVAAADLPLSGDESG